MVANGKGDVDVRNKRVKKILKMRDIRHGTGESEEKIIKKATIKA